MTTPTIPAGNLYMNATLYTGTNSSQTVTNGGTGTSFQPDFVWVKSRSNGFSNSLYDSVRGVRNTLASNSTNAENLESAGYSLTAFNSNGFSVGIDNAGIGSVNASASTYVGWQWKAGGTAVSNTNGSITSSVSANTTSGFSVVTYTGTGANATVGHGLGVAPAWVIVKGRNVGSTNWFIYTATQGATKYLDFSSGTGGTDSSAWNNTAPTSSVFSVGSSYYTNYSATTYVAYCWTPIAGYSAFGSYTGNGSADGTFVYTGFRPRYVIVKRTDAAYGWFIEDSSCNPYNVQTHHLRADTADAEVSSGWNLDTLSNGFKLRESGSAVNASGGTYIYACFGENPFKYALAKINRGLKPV